MQEIDENKMKKWTSGEKRKSFKDSESHEKIRMIKKSVFEKVFQKQGFGCINIQNISIDHFLSDILSF